MDQGTSNRSRIKGLDGTRGLAALGVFLSHRAIVGNNLGGVSVSVFFVLSGYLIVSILMRSRDSVESGASSIKREMARFWVRRSLRVFPAYYLLLLALPVVWMALGQRKSEPGIQWYFCYAQNFYIGSITQHWGRITHLWSLAVEEQFYLFSAPLFLLLPSRHHRIIIAAFIALSLGSVAVMTKLSTPRITMIVSPLFNFGTLGCGAWLAWQAHRQRLTKPSSAAGLLAVLFLVAATYSFRVFHLPQYGLGEFQGYYALALVGSTLLVNYVIGNQTSVAVRLLEWTPLRYLGTISYGVFLYHFIIPLPDRSGYLIGKLVANMNLWQQQWILASVCLVETVLVASLSWFLLELPCLRLKDRLAAGPVAGQFLNRVILRESEYDENTQFPDSLDPAKRGLIRTCR